MAQTIRASAVAGRFYPADPGELRDMVDRYVAEARVEPRAAVTGLIAPHAGYVYSGAIAGSAYKLIEGAKVATVVLVGPSHHVAFAGVAVPSVGLFETPLGRIPIDRDLVERLLEMSQVVELDAAHAQEHSLEVHLPFLQRTLGAGFSLVPLVVGDASKTEVADVLEAAVGRPDTLLVVSTDLSHFLDYDTARARDAKTCCAIEEMRPDAIRSGDACGRLPVQGALELARRRGERVETLDVRSSGDTAGDRSRVVGYGSWVIVGK
jgi:hypothetical protein